MLSRYCRPRGIVKYGCCTAQKHRNFNTATHEPDTRTEIVALKKQIAENDLTIANLLKRTESSDSQPKTVDLDDAEIKLFVSEHVLNIRTRLKRKFATKAIAYELLKEQQEAFGEQELFVSGLPTETTHYDVYKHFGGSSQVLLVNLLRERKHSIVMTHPGPLTGNAFIKMNSPEIADATFKRLDSSIFLGNRLSVSLKLQETGDRKALQHGGQNDLIDPLEDINSVQDGMSFEKSSKWVCESCSFLNFARNSTCQKCGDDRVKNSAHSEAEMKDTEVD